MVDEPGVARESRRYRAVGGALPCELACVLDEAWVAFAATRRARVEMAQAGSIARAMLVSDFTRAPAHRIFAGIGGVKVDDRFGRPWVNLVGGRIQIRFRKLSPDLALCRSDTDRSQRLAFHLGDPVLPGMPAATILTAGYVLDPTEVDVARTVLVCHVGDDVHYSIPLGGSDAVTVKVTDLPLQPLSPPLIRSARKAAAQSLNHRSNQ